MGSDVYRSRSEAFEIRATIYWVFNIPASIFVFAAGIVLFCSGELSLRGMVSYDIYCSIFRWTPTAPSTSG